ncbi:(Fe-S)-binding protein [Desulfosarcina ovata]|uniref:(Fe-S)-binding protein n=1 Tax=Desulfosarcina ovata TaxID=83564 RepID=UPI001E426C4C|nr:(Fe-S)-binding protein [Desulfosarcina ovata]
MDFKQMVLDARNAFTASGVIDPQQYRFLWVDYDWCLFSIFRDTYGLNDRYAPLMKTACDVLFFPGCMLSIQGHRIVESVYEWLGKNGDSVAMLTECCGAPLQQMGQFDRYKDYNETLWRTIKAKGPRQIVTACPTCHAQLIEGCDSSDDIEIVSLYQLMAESGLRTKVIGDGSATVHDSCTDRNGEIGTYVRMLLKDYELKEMAHHGANTICCGSGGLVSAVEHMVCAFRAQTRLDEVAATGADKCITYCMACAHRLATQTDTNNVAHILELVLNQWVDHEQFEEMAGAMWNGEAGEKNIERMQD